MGAALSNAQKPTQRVKENEGTGEYKAQNKCIGTNLNELEIKWFTWREFKLTVIKMLTVVRQTMNEQSENFNRDRKYKRNQRNHRAEEYNWTEKSNSGFNNRLDQEEEKII